MSSLIKKIRFLIGGFAFWQPLFMGGSLFFNLKIKKKTYKK
jgi:hypothetical protein